jgi:hypothetical protein
MGGGMRECSCMVCVTDKDEDSFGREAVLAYAVRYENQKRVKIEKIGLQ